jgi:hypothetical protein
MLAYLYSLPALIAVEVPAVHNLPLAALLMVEAANQNADPARRVEARCRWLAASR